MWGSEVRIHGVLVRSVFNYFLAQSKDDKYLSYSKFATQLPKL